MAADTTISDALVSLQNLAREAPLDALGQGRDLLESLEPLDHTRRAEVLRTMSIAARFTSTSDDSVLLARSALVEARESGFDDLLTQVSITLSGSLALAGENDEALDVLDRLAPSTEALLAEIEFQRGAVLSRIGDYGTALASYEIALSIFRASQDQESLSMTLHNIGLLNMYRNDLDVAESSLREAMDVHASDGSRRLVRGSRAQPRDGDGSEGRFA